MNNLIGTLQERFNNWKDSRPEMPYSMHFEGMYFRVWEVGRELFLRIEDDSKAIHLSINQAEELYKFLKKLYGEIEKGNK